MKIAILLVAHGSPPRDIPKETLRKLRKLRIAAEEGREVKEELQKLEMEIRRWPRNKDNDPYWWHVEKIAKALSKKLGIDTYTAYLEFCSPSLSEKLKEILPKYSTIIITPTMIIKGSKYVEKDIKREIKSITKQIRSKKIIYAYPYTDRDIIELLTKHLTKTIKKKL